MRSEKCDKNASNWINWNEHVEMKKEKKKENEKRPKRVISGKLIHKSLIKQRKQNERFIF